MFWKFDRNILHVDILLIGAIIALGIFLAGGFFSFDKNTSTSTSNTPVASTNGICCDSGDGGACHPLTDATHPTLTYNNPVYGAQTYGLLTSAVHLPDPCHMTKTDQTFQGNPIVINSSEHIKGECSPGDGTRDQIDSGNCTSIPNDEMVYVCIANCYDTPTSFHTTLQKVCGDADPNFSSYGDDKTVYAVYFRLSDYPNPGIPKSVASCQPYITGTPAPTQAASQPTIVNNPYPTHTTMQLNTFTVSSNMQTGAVSENASEQPYCKPAIYLYPEKTEPITVNLAPKGQLLKTIPQYPSSGWHVIASANGAISYQNKNYDYLFYEARIPDSLIPQEQNGYVIAYTHLLSFFKMFLPQTGLNSKETQAFADYWVHALPQAPYYKITLIPQNTLDWISPLTITPLPQTVIRVTLDFQPIDHPEVLFPPLLPEIKRKGFTVVEWAGMYKKDKNHPFTCLQ